MSKIGRNAKNRPSLNLEPLEARRVLAQVLPDLFAWEGPSDNYLHDYRIEGDLLRFSTALANQGEGHLEIRGGDALPNGNQEVFQRIYSDDGTSEDVLAGEFTYHPSHGHIHFDGYAIYNLREQLPDGTTGDVIATGGKVSFCLIDIRILDSSSGMPSNYGGCGSVVQGISAGWSDVYGSGLSDQWINIATVPDGNYFLEVVVDPDDQLIESDETNNVTQIPVTINRGGTTSGDVYEPNNAFSSASDLGVVAYIDSPGLSIHTDTDVDYFKFEAADTGTLEASTIFTNSLGDLSLSVYDSLGGLLGMSDTTEDIELVTIGVTQGESYFVKVDSPNGDVNGYDLIIDGPGTLTTTTVMSEDPNLSISIPDDSDPITSTLEGPDLDLSDVNLVIENLDHSYLGDLRIELTSPSGTTSTLLRAGNEGGYLGGDNDFTNTIFDDQAPNFLGNGSSPFTGSFNLNDTSVGDNPLAAFNGENAAGTWTLSVQDRWGSDTGTLHSWGIQFTGVGAAEGDRFETNDDFPQATDFGSLGTASESDLSIHSAADTDFFRFNAEMDGYVSVDATFSHADGDLELVVYDANLAEVGRSASSDDNESLGMVVSAGDLHFVQVLGVDSATNSDYSLDISVTAPSGDFNDDGVVDADDVSMLCGALASGSDESNYDLNLDSMVDELDGRTLIVDVMGLIEGDANYDGSVDGSDFNIWNQTKFTSGCYGDGDFNFDGAIDGSDFNIWNQNKFTSVDLVAPPVDVSDVSASVASSAELQASRIQKPELTGVEFNETVPFNSVPSTVSTDNAVRDLSSRTSVIERIFAEESTPDTNSFDLDW